MKRGGLLGADDFDVGATVGLQAGDQILVGAVFRTHLLHLSPVTGWVRPLPSVDAVGFDALGDQ